MKQIEMILEKTPDDHDSDNIRFLVDGEEKGYGYMGKDKDSIICIMRCPKCDRENYSVAIATGKCAFCGFDPNKH